MKQHLKNSIAAAALVYAIAAAPNMAQAGMAVPEPAGIGIVARPAIKAAEGAVKCARSGPCRREAGVWIGHRARQARKALIEGALHAADILGEYGEDAAIYLRRQQKLDRIELLHELKIPD